MKTRRAAIYARVSTSSQDPKIQTKELESVAARLGWVVEGLYVDSAVSGSVGREKRPGFGKLQRGLHERRFDVVMAWSVDRLGRSLQDLVQLLHELHARGVDLYLLRQGVDTTTPGGKALFQMVGVFAEFERSLMSERVRAGIARARAKGVRLGRPKISGSKERRIRELRKNGAGIHSIAKTVGCGVSVVQRVVAASK